MKLFSSSLVARTLGRAVCAMVAFGVINVSEAAQEFPVKPIRFIVPYPPGGSGDFVGRLYAERLSKAIDLPVVVDNRPGAATNIAGEIFTRADPDGYTLMMGTSQSIVNTVFGPQPSFDAVTGFAPVAMLAHLPFMIAANPNASIGSAKELVAAASATSLTLAHAQFEAQVRLLSIATDRAIVAVPYKGGAQAVTDALSGQVSMVLSLVPVLMNQVRSDKLRAVGIASATRVSALPDVPTFAEQGYPQFTTSFWMSVLAPKGTPEPILQRLADLTKTVVSEPQYIERLRASGAEPMAASAAETAARMREEHDTWVAAAMAKTR